MATAMFRIAYNDWLDAAEDVDLVDTYEAVLTVHRSITATAAGRRPGGTADRAV